MNPRLYLLKKALKVCYKTFFFFKKNIAGGKEPLLKHLVNKSIYNCFILVYSFY